MVSFDALAPEIRSIAAEIIIVLIVGGTVSIIVKGMRNKLAPADSS